MCRRFRSTTFRIIGPGMSPTKTFHFAVWKIVETCFVADFYQNRMEQFQKAIRKVRQVQRMRKQRGYAFSQTDESQARVLQAYDTTRERGRYGEMASSRR